VVRHQVGCGCKTAEWAWLGNRGPDFVLGNVLAERTINHAQARGATRPGTLGLVLFFVWYGYRCDCHIGGSSTNVYVRGAGRNESAMDGLIALAGRGLAADRDLCRSSLDSIHRPRTRGLVAFARRGLAVNARRRTTLNN